MPETTAQWLEKQEHDVNMSEMGTTGLDQTAGIVREEFLTELRGQQGMQTYREMRDNDPVIGGIIFAMEMLIRQAGWFVKPPEGADETEERTVFIRQNMNDMNRDWDDVIGEILSFLPYGFSIMEKVFKKREEENSQFPDGRIGWAKLAPRAQTTLQRWVIGDTGEVEAFIQLPPTGGGVIEIPREKFLHFRPLAFKNNPEGRSIIRNAYRPWFFKKKIEELEGIGVERDFAGIPKAYVPPQFLSDDATAAQEQTVSAIEDMLIALRNDEQAAIMVPSVFEGSHRLFDIELMNTGGKRQFDTSAIIDRYDRRIAMSMLFDFMLVGHENVGSFALASSKMRFAMMAVGGFLASIKEPFNREAIPELLRVNGMDPENPPRIEHQSVETLDLSVLGEYVKNMVDAGVLSSGPEIEAWARDAADIPFSRSQGSETPEGDSGSEADTGDTGEQTEEPATEPDDDSEED